MSTETTKAFDFGAADPRAIATGPGRRARRRTAVRLAFAALFVIALTAVYSNHFDNAFHFDDSHTILGNSYITSLHHFPQYFQDARTSSSLPGNQSYRPVVTALNAIDYWLAGGLDPAVFHWHIYLEFLVLLWLLYLVLLRVFELADGQKHQLASFLGMAFFAFHTATAETINYIISRSDGFSTLMVLSGFLLYARTTGWKRHLGLIPFAVGCLAKPTTLMLAPLLTVYSLMLERPSLTVRAERTQAHVSLLRALRGTWSYFAAGVALYLFIRWMERESWTPGGQDALAYLVTQFHVTWLYLKTFMLPTGLTADADLELIHEFLSPRVLWGLFVIAAMLAAAWAASRQRRFLPVAFGILWFYLALLPSSSIVPLAEPMNHHRTFFPYIGLVIAVTWLAQTAFRMLAARVSAPRARAAFACVLLPVFALHAFGTWQRNEVWHSDDSLWHDVTQKSPRNGRGLMNYGLALMRVGKFDEATGYFEQALESNYRNHPYLHVNMGIAKGAMARRTGSEALDQQAEDYFRKAVSLGPGYPETHLRYARWLHERGRTEEALSHVRKALQLAPAHRVAEQLAKELTADVESRLAAQEQRAAALGTANAFLDLSLAYYRAEQFEKSAAAARSALAIDPRSAAAWNNICAAHNNLGQYSLAIEACEKALAIDPEFKRARNNLDWGRKKHASDSAD